MWEHSPAVAAVLSLLRPNKRDMKLVFSSDLGVVAEGVVAGLVGVDLEREVVAGARFSCFGGAGVGCCLGADDVVSESFV